MFTALFWAAVGYIVGALTPITLNRVRRALLNGWGKMFGKLDPGSPDPTSAKGSA